MISVIWRKPRMSLIGVLFLSITSYASAYDEWWRPPPEQSSWDIYVSEPFIVNGNDPDTFDWDGYWRAIEAVGSDYLPPTFDPGIGQGPAGGGGGGDGGGNAITTGAARNKHPYGQQLQSSCTAAAIRNVLREFGQNVNEQDIRRKIDAKVGPRDWNGTGHDAGIPNSLLLAALSILKDYGLEATKVKIESKADLARLATSSNPLLGLSVGRDTMSVNSNHMTVFTPHNGNGFIQTDPGLIKDDGTAWRSDPLTIDKTATSIVGWQDPEDSSRYYSGNVYVITSE